MVSDEIMELLLEEQEVPLDLIHKTIREGTIAQQICPVLIGSAYKNKGVQPPARRRRPLPAQPARPRDLRQGQATAGGPSVPRPRRAPLAPWRSSSSRSRSARSPTCGSTRGRSEGQFYYNTRQRKKARISRILRVHADREGRHRLGRAGDIVAVMGSSAATGDTMLRGGRTLAREHLRRRAGHRPVDRAQAKRADYDKLSKALTGSCARTRPSASTSTRRRARRSSPGWASCTWRSTSSGSAASTRSTAPSAMPKVSYREAPTRETPFNYKHKKQTGGSGQYAHVVGAPGAADPGGARAVRLRERGDRRPDPAPSTSPRSRRASATRCPRARSPATR